MILYFRLPYFHVSNSALFFLNSTSVLSFHIGVVLTLSIQMNFSLTVLLNGSTKHLQRSSLVFTCLIQLQRSLFPFQKQQIHAISTNWQGMEEQEEFYGWQGFIQPSSVAFNMPHMYVNEFCDFVFMLWDLLDPCARFIHILGHYAWDLLDLLGKHLQ